MSFSTREVSHDTWPMPVNVTGSDFPLQIVAQERSGLHLVEVPGFYGDETTIEDPIVFPRRLRLVEQSLYRTPSLIETDIRHKVGDYLEHKLSLHELVAWLNNPLLIWDMLAEVVENPAFGAWISKIHGYTVLFTEQRCPESEVCALFVSALSC